jgi:hypothetical protein
MGVGARLPCGWDPEPDDIYGGILMPNPGTPKVYARRYSGKGRSGTCVCGHSWEDHHLGMVLNQDYFEQTGEAYIAQECEFYGSNEMGGLDEEGNDHCHGYRDEMLRGFALNLISCLHL